MKRIIMCLLSFIMCLSVVNFQFASAAENNPSIMPFYEATCPGPGGMHVMTPHQYAYVFSGPDYTNPGPMVMLGYCYRCIYCKLGLATEHEVQMLPNVVGKYGHSGDFGRYNICSYLETVASVNYFYGGIHGTYYGNLSDDPFWAGFSFTYNISA